jgi:putative lipoprotein (rSAM/lipoprotein system)
MKKIQKTYLRVINKIIAIIAAFTGLQACGISITPGYAPPAPLPLAEFSINGRVENKLKEPIPNIEIELTTPNELNGIGEDFNIYHRDRSDSFGNFTIWEGIDENSFWGNGDFIPPKEVALIIRDVDREENGKFKNDTIIVPLEFAKDSTSYFPCSAKVTDLIVTLKEEQEQ